jgi:uncharacterized protein YndB with AHSA1/START domain
MTTEKASTKTERTSDRELVVTRTLKAPARFVFEAWTKPELFVRWWLPASFGITLISHDADVRTGGSYRLVMSHPAAEQPMAFFGKYLEVTPHTRIVWTNEESGENGSVTTVTLEEKAGTTQIVVHELYPSKAALDEALASGSTGGWSVQFEALDELLVGMQDTAV